MDYALLEESCKCSGSFYERNHSLAEHTSMKIGGACDILARPVSEAALADMINVCRREGTAPPFCNAVLCFTTLRI